MNRASDYGSEGYRFESCRRHEEGGSEKALLLAFREVTIRMVASFSVLIQAVCTGFYTLNQREADKRSRALPKTTKGRNVDTLLPLFYLARWLRTAVPD